MQYQQGTSKRCSKWQDQIQIVNLILKVIIVELMRSQALIHLRLIRVALCTRINVQHQERDVLEQDLEVLQVLQDVVLQMENELETLQKATTDEECSRWKARYKINGGQCIDQLINSKINEGTITIWGLLKVLDSNCKETQITTFNCAVKEFNDTFKNLKYILSGWVTNCTTFFNELLSVIWYLSYFLNLHLIQKQFHLILFLIKHNYLLGEIIQSLKIFFFLNIKGTQDFFLVQQFQFLLVIYNFHKDKIFLTNIVNQNPNIMNFLFPYNFMTEQQEQQQI
ncbi:unnamed protein product [Paramecium primaurelia]|uniref:Uncharacterized protein n=1 Tax=Paramecium primaurelia TaxID=5886 RepID=A0A8S1QWI2_PARPR|nr:unnamed protein product [Paramecium primaurelia]